MPEKKVVPKRIVLGSGSLYRLDYTGELPEHDVICVEENRFSFVKGGAAVEYTPTPYTAQDDLGRVKKRILTVEDAKLKTGAMTIDASVLDALIDTARVDSKVPGKTTVLIGGIGNAKNKECAWCFHHEDSKDGDIYVTIRGVNEAGFTLSFNKEQESIIDAELTCMPQDNDVTLIRVEFMDPATESIG